MHKFTNEQEVFIRKHVLSTGNDKLTNIFNKYFNLNLTKKQIQGFKKNHKITSGLTGYFEKGHIPIDAIKKGQRIGIATEFRKGNKPLNIAPIGTEVIKSDGYRYRKIYDKGKDHRENWKQVHRLVWEAVNGPIPKNYKIIFLDSNKLNTDLNNMELITDSEMLIINRNNLIKADAELTRTGIIIAKVIDKANKRKKKGID